MILKPLPTTVAKKPVKRDYEWLPGRYSEHFVCGVMVITTGKKATGYMLSEFAIGSTSGRGFTLLKTFGGSDGEATRYDVFLSTIDTKHHCSCRGFLHKGACKHLAAILAEFGPKPVSQP